jgi:hypothetical protein
VQGNSGSSTILDIADELAALQRITQEYQVGTWVAIMME